MKTFTQKQLRSEAARLLGEMRSEKKARASRRNGKLGGRPVGVKERRPRRYADRSSA